MDQALKAMNLSRIRFLIDLLFCSALLIILTSVQTVNLSMRTLRSGLLVFVFVLSLISKFQHGISEMSIM